MKKNRSSGNLERKKREVPWCALCWGRRKEKCSSNSTGNKRTTSLHPPEVLPTLPMPRKHFEQHRNWQNLCLKCFSLQCLYLHSCRCNLGVIPFSLDQIPLDSGIVTSPIASLKVTKLLSSMTRKQSYLAFLCHWF